MRFSISLLLASVLLIGACSNSDTSMQDPSILPKPASVNMLNGDAFVASEFVINAADQQSSKVAGILSGYILDLGYEVQQTQEWIEANILLELSTGLDLSDEAYLLQVNDQHIKISAASEAGLFYGVQSLRQLLIQAAGEELKLPAMDIHDAPRFPWRGMHLDVSRHFFDVDFVKDYLDYMALFKMNVFHWHLVDDQGWRIEIKQYPKLTEIGAWRDSTIIGHHRDLPYEYDYTRYGGYYTQEEIKEVIAYAAERYIEVIPEIEIPGHSLAAITAYPELGVTGEAPGVWHRWGISPYIYNVEESTFEFLENVLAEVIELFPTNIIHIGGDEALKDQWIASPRVQERIKELGLKDEHEMQSYYIKRMANFVEGHGKKIIGWDEILEGGLAENALVMSWRGTEGGIAAAKMGNQVVMSPTSHCYFDYYQAEKDSEPLGVGNIIDVAKVYSFDPIPEELNEEEAKLILGGQANIWTEFLKTPEDIQYMIFPRFIALSETVWTPKEKQDYEDFVNRLQDFEPYFKAEGINYAPHVFAK